MLLVLLAPLFLGLLALPAAAQQSAWSQTDHGAVRLISATEATGTLGAVSLGLEFTMAPGWKIYWRSPGDAGYPPRVDWSGSENLASATVQWPIPERFSVLGLETIGYKDHVVLPVVATLDESGAPLRIDANVDYLTCSEICVPYTAALSLDLPVGPAQPSPFAHVIDQFHNRVPGDGSAHGLRIETTALGGSTDAPLLNIEASADAPFRAPDVFVEGPDVLAFDPPTVRLDEGGRHAVLEVAVVGTDALAEPLAGTPFTVTVVDGDRAAERRITPAADAAVRPSAPTATTAPLGLILALAVLGGLILNLMPCVLPVLSIKLLGVLGHGGGESRAVRQGFLATAAGIVTAFVILASALVALRQAGVAVGWGLQFQAPWFLVAMTVVVTLFACNLWGFFSIGLPRFVTSADARAGHVDGLAGQFFTGVLATALATPCSAPFVGTAVGFALSQGGSIVFAVFLCLGIGLALPYLAIAAFPRLATRLPRPGPWMVWLRRILGLALAGTGVWLLTILAAQQGVAAALIIGGLMSGLAVAVYIAGLGARPLAPIGKIAAVIVAVGAFLVPGTRTEADLPAPEGVWQPLDVAIIAAHVGNGQIVYVNITADWCITCRVNESLVLNRSSVSERLADPDIVAMRGDWTQPDPAISAFLARFGRYGIPFDAVYGPGLPAGEALPELLTTSAVEEAIARAAAPSR